MNSIEDGPYFLPVVESDDKYYIQLPDERKYISSSIFEDLKRKRYIIYLESIGEWFFYFSKEEEKNKRKVKKVGFTVDYETEYIVFLYEKEKRLHSLEYRDRWTESIATDITFVPCDLLQLFFDGKWLTSVEKGSASQSQIGIGKIKIAELWKLNTKDNEIIKKSKEKWYQDHEVVIKLNFPSLKNNGNEIERIIYQNFILKMLRLGQTPHVMIPLFSYECKNFSKKYLEQKPSLKIVYDWYINLPSDYYDKTKLLVTILEKGKGLKFQDWIKTEHQFISWKSVLFQIIWTIAVFGEYGLVHNDLHEGNIFIEPLENPIICIYFISATEYFVIPINYFVKIYDFDRSTIVANKKNYPGSLSIIKKTYAQTFETKIYNEKIKSKNKFSNKDRNYMNTKDFSIKYRNFKIELREGNNGDESIIENTFLDEYYCSYGQCNRFDPFIDVFYPFWEIYHNDSWENDTITNSIKKWLLKPFYGSTKLLDQNYPFRGVLCKPKNVIDKATGKAKILCNGPIPINPKKDFMDPKTMLLNLFPEFKQKLPYFDPSFSLENNYPHLYTLPSVQAAYPNFLDRLDSINIKPISFKNLSFFN